VQAASEKVGLAVGQHLVKRRRRTLKVPGACQANESVPQVLPLQQNEYNEDGHDPGGRERMDQRRDECRKCLKGAGIRLFDFYWYRLVASAIFRKRTRRYFVIWSFNLLAQVMQYLGRPLDRASSAGHAPQALDLIAQSRLVSG